MLVPSMSFASCFANRMLASFDCPAEQGSVAGQAPAQPVSQGSQSLAYLRTHFSASEDILRAWDPILLLRTRSTV